MNFLILLPGTPYPPPLFNGLSIRYYPFLKNIIEKGHDVTVIIYDYQAHGVPEEQVLKLRNIGLRIIIAGKDVNPIISAEKSSKAIFQLFNKNAIPYDQYNLNFQKIKQACFEAVPYKEFEVGIGVGEMLFAILRKLPEGKKPKKCICDFVDSPTMHFHRKTYVEKQSAKSFLLRCIDSFIYPKWERRIVKHCDLALYSSQNDLYYLWRKKQPANVYIMPNGLTIPNREAIFKTATLSKPAFGFIGNMPYLPNHFAALELIDMWHLILQKIPTAHLYIIGRAPSPILTKKAENIPSIHITGCVENIWEYYLSLDMFLCPLKKGAGIQNKLLEAMWAKVPIVASSIANNGINATIGKHLVTINSRTDFVHAVINLWADADRRKEMSFDAHNWVMEKFNWENIMEDFFNKVYNMVNSDN